MAKNISFFKKVKLFKQFKKTITESKDDLSNQFNIRVDRTSRLYTVLNIPESIVGEAYSLKKSDLDKISENFTREYTVELSRFLDSKNLIELYKVYEIQKVDKFSYLIVIGFSLFKSHKYYNNIYYKALPASIILLISLLILIII